MISGGEAVKLQSASSPLIDHARRPTASFPRFQVFYSVKMRKSSRQEERLRSPEVARRCRFFFCGGNPSPVPAGGPVVPETSQDGVRGGGDARRGAGPGMLRLE